MSFKSVITNQLKIRLLNKNILILKGNTSELILPTVLNLSVKKPNDTKDINPKTSKRNYLNNLTDFQSNNIITFNQYLLHFLYQDTDLLFDNIYLYNSNWENDADVIHGNIKVEQIKSHEHSNDFSDFTASTFTLDAFDINQNQSSKLDMLTRLKKLVIEKINDPYYTQKDLFVLDLGDSLLTDKNQSLDIKEINSIIDLFTNEISSIVHTHKPSNFKLVIIVRNEHIFNSTLFANNKEISTLNIPVPSLEERVQFFNIRSLLFKNLKNELNSKKQIYQAASLTNGLTFRELLQLEYFSGKWSSITDFKELYRLCFFEKRESEWEKINYESLNEFINLFNDRVKGQPHVGEKIMDALIRSNVGLQGILQSSETSNVSKPRGILFFAGPTGVGKTAAVKALSEFIFKDPNQVIRFDMSEYNHEESDQKLLGSPPGYVGYEAGGTLTNAILEKPFSIVLFDEIEKAHQKIFDKFLQILEDGRLTSSKGELVDFTETFIIFTSNIGANNLPDNASSDVIMQHFKREVSEYFTQKLNRPEILNRIGASNIVPFNKITDKNIKLSIIKSKIKKIEQYLFDKKSIKLTLDENIESYYDHLINNSNDNMGIRSLLIDLEGDLISIISREIFKNSAMIHDRLANGQDGCYVTLKLECVKDTVKGMFLFKALIVD